MMRDRAIRLTFLRYPQRALTSVGAAVILALTGCGGGGDDQGGQSNQSEQSSASDTGSGDTQPKIVDGAVQLTRSGMRAAGMKFAHAVAAQPIPVVDVAATIAPPIGARRAVAAPYPGVVREVRVIEGQAVRRGEVLAVVVSPMVVQTGADLQRARAQLEVNRSAAYRTDKLVEAGVVAGARAEEARASLRQSATTVAENRRLLGLAHADATTGTYALVAPIAGRVSKTNAQPGQPIDDGAAPFVIDADGRYALTGQLPATYVGQVRPGMTIRVTPEVTGTIIAVGTTIDEQTRSVPLQATLGGAPGVLSGSSVLATVLAAPPADAVQVPAGALVQVKGRWVVFVPGAKGLVPHPVTIVGRNAERAVVTGLPMGALVIGRGASELKMALDAG